MAEHNPTERSKRPRIREIKEWIISEMKRDYHFAHNVNELRDFYAEFRTELEPFYHDFYDKQVKRFVSKLQNKTKQKEARRHKKLLKEQKQKEEEAKSLSERRKQWIENLHNNKITFSNSARYSLMMSETSAKRGCPLIYIASGGLNRRR